MSDDTTRALGSLAYTMFALQQPLALAEVAAGAQEHRLAMADPQTPDWFAAAASAGSSLLEMAPELQVLPVDLDEAAQVDVGGIDLVHIYAPQLAELEQVEAAPEPSQEQPAEPEAKPEPKPRSTVKFDLLKELSDLDD